MSCWCYVQVVPAFDLDAHEDTVLRACDSRSSMDDEKDGTDTGDSSEDDHHMKEALRQGKTFAKGAPQTQCASTDGPSVDLSLP